MRKEFKIGLAGIVALVILFCGIKYLKGINMFKPESYYLVEFENVNGLPESSPVFANGFKVGIVRDIRYNYEKPGHVLVGIEMDQEMKIPQGSRAELVTEMLGTVKMNLLLDLQSTQYYKEGDTIPGSANNGIMGAAEKDLLPKLQQMMPKMDSILASLNKLLADPALAQTLHNAEQLTSSLNETSRQLNKLMSTDVPQLTENVNVITANLRTVSDNLKDVDYASTIAKVDSTLANVRLLTDKLNRKDNTLGLLMNDSSLYQNLNATSANAASLLEDLKAHPKRYVHFSLFGKKDK
ncbi:MlaD family protein [Bacteroides gallinaceum]|uniref:MlaD family protein n=1 Tax=Bacteroides gallinaceum TaxID=1462571 RepID=UPI0015A98703|nr:MlaD family protein [Bacteroides gallinaceum]MDM8153684.1 MlaD family protein [Bacteroides gallinaceum]